MPHAGIIRLVNLGTSQQTATCLRVIKLHGDDLKAGAIITVESNRLRVRLTTDREE
jgi:predicted nuclease of predicted toxin-antitoxin system